MPLIWGPYNKRIHRHRKWVVVTRVWEEGAGGASAKWVCGFCLVVEKVLEIDGDGYTALEMGLMH